MRFLAAAIMVCLFCAGFSGFSFCASAASKELDIIESVGSSGGIRIDLQRKGKQVLLGTKAAGVELEDIDSGSDIELEEISEDEFGIESGFQKAELTLRFKEKEGSEKAKYNFVSGASYSRAEEYFNKGLEYAGKNEYDKAIDVFSKVIEIVPDAEGAYFNRGIMYERIKEYKNALSDFSKAIEYYPAYIEAYLYRGIVLSVLHDYFSSKKDFNRVIEMDPSSYEAYQNRGSVNVALKDYRNALNDYTKAITLEPFSVKAHINRGVLYRHLGDFNSALVDFSKALELDLGSFDALYRRATTYYIMEDFENAKKDYKKAIQLKPQYADTYLILATLYSEENTESAIKYYRKFLEYARPDKHKQVVNDVRNLLKVFEKEKGQ